MVKSLLDQSAVSPRLQSSLVSPPLPAAAVPVDLCKGHNLTTEPPLRNGGSVVLRNGGSVVRL
jgi:hypothetical protein